MHRRLLYIIAMALLVSSALHVVWMTYSATSGGDRGFGSAVELSLAFWVFVLVSVAAAIIMGIAYWQRAPRSYIVAFGCVWAAMVIVTPIASWIGNSRWESTFAENRRLADQVVAAIHGYHAQTGHYPHDLSAIKGLVVPEIQTVRENYPLEYALFDNGDASLTYSYGWYWYRYDFNDQLWHRFD